jgi:hypothetical protein
VKDYEILGEYRVRLSRFGYAGLRDHWLRVGGLFKDAVRELEVIGIPWVGIDYTPHERRLFFWQRSVIRFTTSSRDDNLMRRSREVVAIFERLGNSLEALD